KPVTADDVLWSYNVMMNKKVRCGHLQGTFLDIMNPDPKQACRKVGDDTIHFELKKQYYASLNQVGNGIYILPSHRYGYEKYKGDDDGFGEYFNTHPEHRNPVGNGRYKFGKWEPSKFVEIVRNEDYWACQKGQEVPWIDPLMPYLDSIRWITIPSKSAGLKALVNG